MEEEYQHPAGLRLATILLSLFLGTFLVAIDTTIVSVAIPKISTQFNALDDVGWYGSAYLITITAFQPAGGTIYKLFHAKIVYLSAIVVFEGRPLEQFYNTCSSFDSWLGPVCGSSEFSSVHCGKSSCRDWCCSTNSRSYKRHHICFEAGRPSSLHWPCGQLLWDIRELQSGPRWCFDLSCELEMVLLDVISRSFVTSCL